MIKYNNIYSNVIDYIASPSVKSTLYVDYLQILNDVCSLFYFECIKLNYSQVLVSNLALSNIKDIHFIMSIPETFIMFMLFILLIYSLWSYQESNKDSVIDISFGLLSINLFSFFLYLNILSYKSYFLFNSMFLVDFYSTFSKLLFLFSSSLVMLLNLFVLNKKKSNFNRYEYPLIIGFANLGCCLLISSYDLILFYLSIECLSFCLYILVLLKIKNKLAAESGLKYFCLGALASTFMLFGIALLYGCFFTTNYLYIKTFIDNFNNQSITVYLGFLLILFGFFFKLALFPYHMTLIDVYDGSALSVTAYLITIVKLVMVIVLCKMLMYTFYSIQFLWSPLLSFVSISSMLWGSFGALYQQRIKRFFAYSSIHQVGYITLSLAAGSSTSLFASLFYVVVYNLTTLTTIGFNRVFRF